MRDYCVNTEHVIESATSFATLGIVHSWPNLAVGN